MRGLGNVYKRGPVYWIRFHHRGVEYRESARSSERSVAVRLLKQRLAALGEGGPAVRRGVFSVRRPQLG
jgi:hypothetical protein